MKKRFIPELSVIVVNYNGARYAARCIKSILSSKTISKEIIIVDNHSTQNDVAFLKNKFNKKVKIIKLRNNYGPARARNEGVKLSKGKYIAFLDNDTKVHPNWANKAIEEFKMDNSIGIIQCKLLLLKEPHKIDYVGEYLGQYGFLVQRAKGGDIDSRKFDKKTEILAAKSAGMFIRKDTFNMTGGFDIDYFIYVEETDLGWRSWLKGYRSIYLPSSVVYHEFGTSSIILSKNQNLYNTKFHGSKNYILTLIKNLGNESLIPILPLHVFLWIGLSLYVLLKGDYKSSFWILKGVVWNITHLKESLRKRRIIQRKRVALDRDLFPKILVKKPFKYFLEKATVKHTVGNAQSF